MRRSLHLALLLPAVLVAAACATDPVVSTGGTAATDAAAMAPPATLALPSSVAEPGQVEPTGDAADAPAATGTGVAPADAPSVAPQPPGTAGALPPTAPPAAPAVDPAAVAAIILGTGAVTTPTGVAFEDIAVGSGRVVEPCDFVGLTYKGRAYGKQSFPGSESLERPIRFSAGTLPPQVIAGLDQGVLGMRLGGRRTLVVPPELALRPDGYAAMPAVPQGEVLILEAELVELSAPPSFSEQPDDVAYVAGERGLELFVLEEGSGEAATASDIVQIHYAGWLEGGSGPVDSSMQPAIGSCRPYIAALGRGEVIVGWDLGIPGMKVGERRQLRLPPSLAFGSAGYDNVPPNATLIFQVVLLAVE